MTQSPLQRLLDELEARCEPAECPTIGAAAAEAARQAPRVPTFADVATVLLGTNVQGCVPDEEHVSSCKQRGAAAFGRGQYRQAAQLFSEALRYCDESGGSSSTEGGAQLAARLYCNRALCLTKMQPPQLEAALQDGGAAIACDPAFPKGWYRRASAARALGHGANPGTLQDARRALQLLQEQVAGDTTEAAALVAALEAEQEAASRGSAAAATAARDDGRGEGAASTAVATSSPCANGHATPREIAGATTAPAGGNPAAAVRHLVLAAGHQLAVLQTEDAGRCLVAAEALPAGRDVLREQPFAHALAKQRRRSACATCLAPLANVAAPFYCRRCPMPAYCCAACRTADPYHHPGSAECGRPWTVLLPVEALAALRLARRLRADGAASPAACQVAALGTHFEEMDPTEVVQLAALAAVSHATWQQAVAECRGAAAARRPQAQGAASGRGAEVEEELLESDVTAEDVLVALCRMQRRGSGDRLALALYPAGSLMNHSCLPNVATRFEGGQLVVRTVEEVAAGQLLLHCYGPQVGEMTASQRQRLLWRQYHFACRCRACSVTQGQLVDVALAGLKCPGSSGLSGSDIGGDNCCEGAVLPTCSVAAGVLHSHQLPAGTGACCTCGVRLTIEQWQQRLLPELVAAAMAQAGAAAALEQQEQQLCPGQAGAGLAMRQAIRSLRQCLWQRQQHLHPHNLLLGATHDALAHAWHLAGNDVAAAQHLRHSLVVLQHSYPPSSTAMAFQRRQLGQALRLAAAAAGASGGGTAEALLAEARQVEEEAEAVLALHFGA